MSRVLGDFLLDRYNMSTGMRFVVLALIVAALDVHVAVFGSHDCFLIE